jgi:multicomponent Na+:H+ antiporter subunit B
MSRRARLFLFLAAATVVAVLYIAATVKMPHFGASVHPYRDLSVTAAVEHSTANVVSSVNFDQRGLDTLIEESILLASVLGVAALLRPARGEEERHIPEVGRILDSTRLLGYVLLPVTAVVGIDLIVHGHLTPGGGFQGGVVLGTGVHLLYVAGSFRAVEGIRPLVTYRVLEAIGAAGYACLGLAGSLAAGAFLTNLIPHGQFGHLFSAGTVPILNGLVGVEVLGGTVVLLASFLDQEILIRSAGDTDESDTDPVPPSRTDSDTRAETTPNRTSTRPVKGPAATP